MVKVVVEEEEVMKVVVEEEEVVEEEVVVVVVMEGVEVDRRLHLLLLPFLLLHRHLEEAQEPTASHLQKHAQVPRQSPDAPGSLPSKVALQSVQKKP